MSLLPRTVRPLTGLFLLCLLFEGTRLAPAPPTLTPTPAAFAGPVRSHPEDSPDEAQEYYRAKRAPVGEKALPVERYLVALEEMRRMPQHSIARDAFLPSRAELEDKGLSYVFDAASLGAWSPLGPGNVGGRTRALVIDPRNPDVMYAGGVAGGVWKTTDGGGSWTPLADFMANLAISSLAMDPANGRVLYAGTGEVYTGDGVRGAGIFKSTDAGGHWTRLAKTQTPDFYFVNDIVVSPKSSARVYAATFTGVWRSTNGGTTWKRVLVPSGSQGCTDLAIRTDRADDFLFAACGITQSGAVYRNDKAQAKGKWVIVLSEPEMSRTSLAIAPSNQDVIYALASSNDSGPSFGDGEDFYQGLHAVFRSDRAGVPGSWSAQVRNTDPVKLNRMLLSNPVQSSLRDCGFAPNDDMYSQGWYDNVIAVDPTDPDRVLVGGIDLFRSDDGGRNWGLASYWWADQPPGAPSFSHADQHSIVFHPGYDGAGNRTLYATSDGGIFRTDDAQAATGSSAGAVCSPLRTSMRWTSLNHGYGVTQFYHGAPFPDGSRYLGGTQDNGTVLGGDGEGPDGWRRVLGGDGGYVAIDPDFPDIVFAEFYRLSLQISRDGGFHWIPATAGITGSFPFIAPFVMDPNRSQRLWLGGGSLWRTDDIAVSWTRASTNLGSQGLVSAVTVARGHSDRVLAGTEGGSILRNDAGLSANGQTEWPAARPREGWVSSVTFDPADPEVAYATYSTFGGTHVWKSTDGGANWRGIDGTGTRKIPDIPVHVLVVDPHQTSHLFVGTDLGVFVSTDGGATWAVENTGFANVTTEWLTVLESSGAPSTLFAFTHGRGAWKVTIQE